MKLTVANRGEIAVRILDTAATLGIPTVAVHPDDDAACLHVARADEAVRLPGTGAAAYLDVAEVVAAAVKTGATALHPGYGFLSENPALARECDEQGITFVGPAAEALELFGSKTAARDRARAAGVPVLEGTAAPTDPATARAFLEAHGAVMVKALAGGGGRGMRPVADPADLATALRECAAEAQAAFGDGAVYVEQYLPGARHVEVQVVGDGTRAVALGDRDCSAQRRRQKLVEIAPAPDLPGRDRLHAMAVALVGEYRGLATVEFLVAGEDVAFLEVNPRIQVEHTVTEEVTGLDLVEVGLRIAEGATLGALGLVETPVSRGTAVQVRVNTETVEPDGTVVPHVGTLERFGPPTGPGVRVDTHAYPGWTVSPRYDSLLAKVVTRGADLAGAVARGRRALDDLDVAGVTTNAALLHALLGRAELGALDTGFVDGHLAELTAGSAPSEQPADADAVVSPQAAVVVAVSAAVGDLVPAGAELVVVEAMKMQHVVHSPRPGRIAALDVAVGDAVSPGTVLARLQPSDAAAELTAQDTTPDPDHVRADLAETLERHRVGRDEARPDAVAKAHGKGRRTVRENLADLLDPDSLVEYGALTVAAQRRRRDLDDLIARTPADGLVTGTGTVGGLPVAVLAYDYSVLAGTQGVNNHAKTDRLFTLALRERLPVVVLAEGGGGRPGDTDTCAIAQLDVPSFRLAAELRGTVPTLAVVTGYCFAGNAALAGACDTIIATEDSSLGMGGPAMIEGGGLGVVAPSDVGPIDVQWANGVVDVRVADDAAAVDAARRWLGYFGGSRGTVEHDDPRRLRHLVPENRLRSYAIRPVLAALFDTDSVLELRGGFGAGVVTALARLGGRPLGVLANNPEHLGGAIDGDAADKAAGFLELCEARRLPVVSLCDTPGFMVGPDAERTGTVRRFSAMFVAGARLTVPLVTVVLRKGYGLGAMAMAGGDLKAPALTVAWPSGEFGGMGLEGAVRLGYRKELEAITDPGARRARYDELVAEYYERGKALSVASVFEVDDVIDPADTRAVVGRVLDRRGSATGHRIDLGTR
ncbi:carboxyl transferase domain-containing protein [Actinomycetospora sp. TBRC 11914]|uniref:acetyl-CoA carboxylase family protein n=1 Tax=Actinomycetospora sp. TBRC 11914 TaxID=2729387 RepID=UPI00145C62B7|nr:carboxyl transferase domain-containing protein [Actinomycetospora sp. TBRC 11914]NMO93913.1 carbamoyl-phosphate synthase large subunit [Actinomycetospora sp. TBRC 11914]